MKETCGSAGLTPYRDFPRRVKGGDAATLGMLLPEIGAACPVLGRDPHKAPPPGAAGLAPHFAWLDAHTMVVLGFCSAWLSPKSGPGGEVASGVLNES